MARVIDGKDMAARLLARTRIGVREHVEGGGRVPGLAVVQVGENPASSIYVRNKIRTCRECGIADHAFRLAEDVSQDRLLDLIDDLNGDPQIHGILVQLPLPAHIDAGLVTGRIAPGKDVDGFHPVNVGRLSIGEGKGLVPCTPLGCMMLLDSVIDDFAGLDAIVVGKSNIVGKPMALLLLERECTVTVTHLATRNLDRLVRKADIVVVAAGHAGLIRGDWVKPGAVLIDVGINRVARPDGGTRIVGDACSDELDHLAAYTPVPGGVGPMTVACLVANTLAAARQQGGGAALADDATRAA